MIYGFQDEMLLNVNNSLSVIEEVVGVTCVDMGLDEAARVCHSEPLWRALLVRS